MLKMLNMMKLHEGKPKIYNVELRRYRESV